MISAAAVRRDYLEPALEAQARNLRGPLRTIAKPADADPVASPTAVRAIDDLLAQVSRAQLLTPGVRHELGHAPFCLLQRLVAR